MSMVVVMVTTSYPRFPGDSVGTFMEPIARSVAARGHRVHIVAPWHPLVRRPRVEHGLHFHFYKYAPIRALNVFGYAAAMRADVSLKGTAYVAAPLALARGWWTARKIARRYRASVVHGHWVVPSGAIAALAAPNRPLVVSLHGSDVYVAERVAPARMLARRAFRQAGAITACSADLAARAVRLGADPARVTVVPYGVDTGRFRPDPAARRRQRTAFGIPESKTLIAAAGRLVSKKGFEYLIDALPRVSDAVLVLAGEGTLREALQQRAAAAGVHERVRFLGDRSQEEVAALFSGADIIVAPSIRDESGNVDGLPNVVMEALASGTPLVTTTAGGIGAVVEDGVTAIVVPERNAEAIAAALVRLRVDRGLGEQVGAAGRALVEARFGWDRTAEQFERAYERALAMHSGRR